MYFNNFKSQRNVQLIDLNIRDRLKILFTDYLIFIILIFIITSVFPLINYYFPRGFRLIAYVIYYTFSEYIFSRTLGMRLWNVEIYDVGNKNKLKRILIYSVLIILDRFVFSLYYLFLALLNYENKIFLSEKRSQFMWKKVG